MFARWSAAAPTARSIDEYLAFRAGLRAILSAGSAHALGAFLCASGEQMDDYELAALGRSDALEVLLHRLILADIALADHHAASRAWLRLHGLAVPPASRGYGHPNVQEERLLRTA